MPVSAPLLTALLIDLQARIGIPLKEQEILAGVRKQGEKSELDSEGGGLDELPVPISTPGFDNAPYTTCSQWITKDPDTGTHIKQVTFTNTGASTGNAAGYGYYAQGTLNATFSSFRRNLSSNALEATVQAIMINLCLKCHGAQATLSPAVKEKLSALYPQDKATGYSLGQIRGAMTIRKPL